MNISDDIELAESGVTGDTSVTRVSIIKTDADILTLIADNTVSNTPTTPWTLAIKHSPLRYKKGEDWIPIDTSNFPLLNSISGRKKMILKFAT